MQVEEDLDDLDVSQVTERGRKRWKEDNFAKETLMRCAEEASGRATTEVKDITSRLMQDAADRDIDASPRLTGSVRGVSETMEGRMSKLEKGCKING